jgi:hypothetical protein
MNLNAALALELRNAARLLMANLYWAQKRGADKESWGPTDPNEMLGWRNGSLLEDVTSIDSNVSPVSEELRPICNILRRQIVHQGFLRDMRGNPVDGYYEYDQADLDALKSALNSPIQAVETGYIDHSTDRPCYLMTIGPTMRILADQLMRFTFMLVQNYGITGTKPVFGLHEYNPIAVCPYCNGLFLKTKASQKHCSVNCRVAHWGQKQGKEYFRVKQAEYRAGVKEQEERIKAKQRKSPARKGK